MKGKFMDGPVLLAGVLFFILAYYVYARSENSDYKKIAELAEQINTNVSQVEKKVNESDTKYKNLVEANSELLNNLNHKVKLLEERSMSKTPIEVVMREPIKIRVLHKTVVPPVPQTLVQKLPKTPLLDKAGITKGMN